MTSIGSAPAARKQQVHHALNRQRRARGWSHGKLAYEASKWKPGITYVTVQRIELGITADPHEATKHAIASALGVEVFSLWP